MIKRNSFLKYIIGKVTLTLSKGWRATMVVLAVLVLSHSLVDKNVIDRYGKESKEQTIKDAISSFIDEE